MNTYEAMFVMDSGMASDWKLAEGEIKRLTDRAEAQLLCCRRWDERRLAYEIGGRKRGCYVLTYFRADPSRIVGLERDAQLSENVLRTLVLRADHVSEEEIRTHAQAGAEQAAVMRDDAGTRPAADQPQDKHTATEPKPAKADTRDDAHEREESLSDAVSTGSQLPVVGDPSDETPSAEQPTDGKANAVSDESEEEETRLP